MIGQTLAHYRITAKIGAGGMGDVYRAGDSKLGRDVALKVLPDVFAKDPERMARFQREAQLLASLNHPNIAAIYGFEEAGDVRALVLELVEGPTLAERIQAGALGVDEALRIAAQIADALESAHEKGIIHRDLKPANVKLTNDGQVKVLDFGLAKALEESPGLGASSLSADSPTISPAFSAQMTGANMILGTAAYMSPEQARGKPVDKRCDIWSFGVVLFEMLTGRMLFQGETVSDTLASVLKTDPDWEQLPPLSSRVRRLLRRCLERDPKLRLRDIGDARLALRDEMEGVVDEGVDGGGADGAAAEAAGSGAAGARSPRWLLPVAVLAAAVVTAAAVWTLRPSSATPPLRKFAMTFPAGTSLARGTLAPDASAVAYTSEGSLAVHDFETLETRDLADGQRAEAPFWSPDGEWIAYGAERALWKVRRIGGTPVRLASLTETQQLTEVGGGVWSADGWIAFASGDGGLFRVSGQGGDVSELAATPEGVSDFHAASALPDDAGWLVVEHRAEAFDTVVGILRDGTRREILKVPGENLFTVLWSPTGHLLFARRGSSAGVYAVRTSADGLNVIGEPFLVASGAGDPSIAADGTLAFVSGPLGLARILALVDRSGQVLRTVAQPGRWSRWPTISGDGEHIVVELLDEDSRNLWLVDTGRGSARRLTTEPGPQYWGSFSADGSEVYYTVGDLPNAMVRARSSSGAGEPRDVIEGADAMPSADGRWLLFVRGPRRAEQDIWAFPLDREDAEPAVVLNGPENETTPMPSPADPLLAYVSERTGTREVYLTTYPDVQGQWPVSIGGGDEPRWRGDGRELYYSKRDSVMVVTVEPRGNNDVRLGRPELLFLRPDHGRLRAGSAYGAHPTADGQTFAIGMEDTGTSEAMSLVVVQNWVREFGGE